MKGKGAMHRPSRRAILSTVATLVVLAFAYFVWPTPYRYMTWSAEGITWPVRVSRRTGRAELLSRVGWLPMEPAPQPRADAHRRP